jgi:hypothetical protein
MIKLSPYEPTKIDSERLEIYGFSFPIESIGCKASVDEIIDCWETLELGGFPLNHISALFIGLESVGSEYLIPLPHHLIRLVDSIICCGTIPGAEKRVDDLKKKLQTEVENAKSIRSPHQTKIQYQIVEDVIQGSDEFQTADVLYKLDNSLEFNSEQSGGADFRTRTTKIRIEAKSKLNRSFADNFTLPPGINREVCKVLMSLDAFKSGSLENAFQDQAADITATNLRHSEFGVIFAAYAYSEDMLNYSMKKALAGGLDLVNKAKKAVILFTEAISVDGSYALIGLACNKDTVISYGAQLDKTERESRLNFLDRRERFFWIIDKAKSIVSNGNS